MGSSKDVRSGERGRAIARPGPTREELRHQRLCTCGLTDAQCQVSSDGLEWVPRNDHLRLPDKLNYLLDKVNFFTLERNREIDWIVDSSQEDLDPPFEEFPNLEIRVVFLVRDVRSWVYARARDAANRGKRLPPLRTLARWTKDNFCFERELRRSDKPVFLLGYEHWARSKEASGSSFRSLDLDYAKHAPTRWFKQQPHNCRQLNALKSRKKQGSQLR